MSTDNQLPLIQKNRKVVVLTPSQRGAKAARVHKERIVIGSVVSADIKLGGDGISPIHAVIEVLLDGATLFDLASESGVFVNGQKIVTHVLKLGDEISIGKHRLKFGLEDPSAAGAPPSVGVGSGQQLFMSPDEDLRPLLLEDASEVEDIFDYRPSAKLALEVVMSWKSTILDVEHFTTERAVTVGNARKSDFAIPPILPAKRYPILKRQGEEFVLNLDPQMKGVMHREGKLQSLEQVCAGLVKGPSGYQLPVRQGEFAKVSLGDIDFYMSYTAAPPRLKRKRLLERDPFFFRILLLSLILTLAMVVALLKAPVSQNIEAEQLPERIATILYQPDLYARSANPEPKPRPQPPVVKPPVQKQPEKDPTPPKITKVEIKPGNQTPPKEIPKVINTGGGKNTAKTQLDQPAARPQARNDGAREDQAREGEGAKASGTSGTRGKPNARDGATPQDRATRPSPDGGKGRGQGNSQVSERGNVDFLKEAGGKIQDLLGGSAAKLGKSGSKLGGFGAFDTRGGGGLALSGEGSGGGGTAADLGGLGNKGTGGGKVGTGKGAIGTGSGIVGGKARVVIRTGGPEEAVVMGAIDAAAVEAALLAYRDHFIRCYEKEINAGQPRVAGRVGTSFVIGPSGRVTTAGLESTTLNNANVERCVLGVIKIIPFPAPRGGGIVQVVYPFKFNTANR